MSLARKTIGIRKPSMSTPDTTQRKSGAILKAVTCIRTLTTMWAATQSSTELLFSACGSRILARFGITAVFHPPGQSPTTTWNLITVRPSSFTKSTETAGKILLNHPLEKRLETEVSVLEISRVVVERNGSLETYSGDIVVVSCGAINSAALLLRSANDKHPQGLANSSDVVGRHYMGHTNSVLMAISRCPNPTIFQKTLSVNDFYFGSRDFEYPMAHI